MAPVRIPCGRAGSRSSSVAPSTSTSSTTSATPEGLPKEKRTPLLTLKDVAEFFSVSERTVHRWIYDKIDPLPVIRLKGLLRFHQIDIERFSRSSCEKTEPDGDLDQFISQQTRVRGPKP